MPARPSALEQRGGERAAQVVVRPAAELLDDDEGVGHESSAPAAALAQWPEAQVVDIV